MGMNSATFTSLVCLLCANLVNFDQLQRSNRLDIKVATTLGLIFFSYGELPKQVGGLISSRFRSLFSKTG